MFQVKPAQISDLEKIHQIETECFGSQGVNIHQLRWILEKQGEKPVIFLNVAVEDEDPKSILGFICWKSNPGEGAPHYEILDLAIAKLFRREGAAQALVKDLVARAKTENHLGVVCYLSEGNPEAYSLYEKLGFVVQKVIPKYYQDGTSAFLLAIKA